MTLVSIYENTVKREKKRVQDLKKKISAEKKTANSIRREIRRHSDQIKRSKSESTIRSKLSQIERREKDLARSEGKITQRESDLTKAEEALGKAESSLEKAKANEEKKAEQKRGAQAKRDTQTRKRKQAQQRATAQAQDQRITELEEKVIGQERAAAPEEIRVLLLAATPEDQDDLRISRETREIEKKLRASDFRDSIQLVPRMARQLGDLIQDLNETDPHVLHFSGHGSEDELVFEDEDGKSALLSNDQLERLLDASGERIRLVIFNSCNSAAQAELAIQRVELAIGMNESIGDEAAKVFAAQFYGSLGFGLSVDQAFKQAKVQMGLEFGQDYEVPELFYGADVDPRTIVLVNPDDGS